MYQLTIHREFDTPVDRLYQAWSQVDTIKRWFAPGSMTVPLAEAEVKTGGRYRIVMQDDDGSQHIVGGQYRQVVANQRLDFSWQWEGSPKATNVSVRFKSLDGDRSALELVHSEFDDQETCDKHDSGWNGCLVNLPTVFQ